MATRPHLRGYRLPERRERHRPLYEQVARPPVAGRGLDAMVRAFDFFDRINGQGRYYRPDPDEWQPGVPGCGDDLDESIPF